MNTEDSEAFNTNSKEPMNFKASNWKGLSNMNNDVETFQWIGWPFFANYVLLKYDLWLGTRILQSKSSSM